MQCERRIAYLPNYALCIRGTAVWMLDAGSKRRIINRQSNKILLRVIGFKGFT